MSGGRPGGSARDGSPVAAYLALPAGYAPELIHNAVGDGGTILELGCGVGRVTRPLLAWGHEVVAVDDSPEMLQHVTGVRRVCGDVVDLNLRQRFDGVVAGSHLINRPERERRLGLLATCRRHLAPGGAVLVERYEPRWAAAPQDKDGKIGPVEFSYRVLARRGPEFDGSLTYRLGQREWVQTFSALALDDGQLAADAAECDLSVERWLGVGNVWALLRSS